MNYIVTILTLALTACATTSPRPKLVDGAGNVRFFIESHSIDYNAPDVHANGVQQISFAGGDFQLSPADKKMFENSECTILKNIAKIIDIQPGSADQIPGTNKYKILMMSSIHSANRERDDIVTAFKNEAFQSGGKFAVLTSIEPTEKSFMNIAIKANGNVYSCKK